MAKKNKGKFHPNLTLDKSMMPSRYTTVGPERAPHRSYLYAMGLTEKQINQGMEQNFCRCGAQVRIVAAIEAAGKAMGGVQ